MSRFHHDKLENEKNEPIESSNLKIINVPLALLGVFLGFGMTYLALRTDRVTMSEGDSRTHTAAPGAPAAPIGGGAQVNGAALLAQGKQVFTTSCQACHQANGQGIPGAFPPLDGSEWVSGPATRMIAIVLHGINGEITVKGQKFHSVMPTFQELLKPEEIAAVVTYVRQTFGKTTDVIDAKMVEAVKAKTAGQKESWAGEAALNSEKWE